jgi:hypothetical protein
LVLLLGQGNVVPLWDSLLSSSRRKIVFGFRRGRGVIKEPVNRQISHGRLAPRPFSKDLLLVGILFDCLKGAYTAEDNYTSIDHEFSTLIGQLFLGYW